MNPPEKIFNVSRSQFSVACYYGGCTFNGASYIYNPEDDTLTKVPEKPPRKRKSKQSTVGGTE